MSGPANFSGWSLALSDLSPNAPWGLHKQRVARPLLNRRVASRAFAHWQGIAYQFHGSRISIVNQTLLLISVLPPSTLKTCPGIAHESTAVELTVIVGFWLLSWGILLARNPNCSCKSQYIGAHDPSLQNSPGGHWQSVIHP